MKINPINFNINSYKPAFKSNEKRDEIRSCAVKEIDSKKETEAMKLLVKSRDVLLSADIVQKVAKRKREEAENIYFNWQEKRPATVYENGATKEYLTTWDGNLNLYIETREDGSGRTIKYLYGEVADITETDVNGKQIIYYFDKKALSKAIQGKHTEIEKRQTTTITPREYVFSPTGKLMIYREDYKVINAYNRSEELLGDFTTIKTAMHFNISNSHPILEKARTGVFISPSGKRFFEGDFKFDENENLV